ncbi:dsDNA nuclease domain-containing protein [Streptomyces sp. NBC_01477]|uniref:dsDNA nuclease domain-containing protein n=1 Tax=Streptomyces sp. NBC_01477 TaxID=2976015 RepID=UPI002E303E58|nr:dsDNA nuclease domain-containing protein [Streptomyces sp. NBC_01477]
MADPIDTEAPDDTGSATVERFEYQVQVTLRAVLQMLAGGSVLHVTCEHIEDIVVASDAGGAGSRHPLWDFQQIKTRDAPEAWGLSAVLDSKPLLSLWRTHKAVRDLGLHYRLTAGLEGFLDPGDEDVQAVACGRGGERAARLRRIAQRTKITDSEAAAFLPLVRIQPLPRRVDIEHRNLAVLAELGGQLTGTEVKALYEELVRRTREALQGRLGPRWPSLITSPQPSTRVLNKRINSADIADLERRLLRPDHVLLQRITQSLTGMQTPLVRKMTTGAVSPGILENAQLLRANADNHRLTEEAMGTWDGDPEVEEDLDQRLLVLARTLVAVHNEARPKPADAIFAALLDKLTGNPDAYDRRPLYRKDAMLLMGRACVLSDGCHFGWGDANA